MTDLIRSAGLSCYPEVARSLGLDPNQMMRKVRLPLACLEKPDVPIAVTGCAACSNCRQKRPVPRISACVSPIAAA